ncbi:MAG: tetratricopeptide repeat protein [bacterium]|nr:MAG: tetratricopeptide repeat protein [bacterium]
MNDQDIQRYEQMLSDDPNSRAFAPLADAYRKAGKLEDAIRVAESGVRRHPHYSGGLVVLGRALLEAGEMGKAMEIMERAVQEAPENYLAQKTLGKIAKVKGENERAVKAYKAALLLSPEDKEIEGELRALEGKVYRPNGLDFVPEVPDAGGPEPVKPAGPAPSPADSAIEPLGDGATEDLPEVSPSEVVEKKGEPGADLPEHLAPLTEGIGWGQDDEDPEVYYQRTPLAQGVDEEDVPDFIRELTGIGPEPEQDLPTRPGTEAAVVTPPDAAGEGIPETPTEQHPPEEAAAAVSTGAVTVGETVGAGGGDAVEDRAGTGKRAEPPPAEKSPSPGEGDDPAEPGEEGVSTETLADLYAEQGLTDQAVAIYRRLLEAKPDDAALVEKIRAAEERQERTAPEPAVQAPARPGSEDVVAVLEKWLENVERMRRR